MLVYVSERLKMLLIHINYEKYLQDKIRGCRYLERRPVCVSSVVQWCLIGMWRDTGRF